MNAPLGRPSFQSLVFLVVTVVALALYTNAQEVACTDDQQLSQPCRCCKMGCWYAIAKTATHELGHIPGQAGEEEAMATLKLIRVCMMEECAEVCAKRSAFRAGGGGGLAALLEAQKRLQN